MGRIVTREELVQIFGPRSRPAVIQYYDDFLVVLDYYKIDRNSLRLAHFLAQVGHESMGLLRRYEIWPNPNLDARGVARSGNSWQLRYEGRADLGNTQTGDGYRYRGRGFMQLTGRANYEAFSKWIGHDCVANPDLVAEEFPVAVAGWFWRFRSSRGNLNRLADRDDLLEITKGINGGTNGLQDRRRRLIRSKHILAAAA